MAKNMETTCFGLIGFRIYKDIPSTMENPIEQKMDRELEYGFIQGL